MVNNFSARSTRSLVSTPLRSVQRRDEFLCGRLGQGDNTETSTTVNTGNTDTLLTNDGSDEITNNPNVTFIPVLDSAIELAKGNIGLDLRNNTFTINTPGIYFIKTTLRCFALAPRSSHRGGLYDADTNEFIFPAMHDGYGRDTASSEHCNFHIFGILEITTAKRFAVYMQKTGNAAYLIRSRECQFFIMRLK